MYEFTVDFHYNGKVVSTDRLFLLYNTNSSYVHETIDIDPATLALLKRWATTRAARTAKLNDLIAEFGHRVEASTKPVDKPGTLRERPVSQ